MESSENSCGLLVDLSDPFSPPPEVKMAPPSLQPRTGGGGGGRRSFYTLPRSLEAEDDPFGLLARAAAHNNNSTNQSGLKEMSLMLMEEVNTGSLIEIESSGSGSRQLLNPLVQETLCLPVYLIIVVIPTSFFIPIKGLQSTYRNSGITIPN